MMTREQARQLADRIIGLSKADEIEIGLDGGSTSHLRFARNTPSTSGTFTDTSLSIRSTFGNRNGSVTINQFDDATLSQAVRRSEDIAKLAPEDPEHLPGLGPQQYLEVNGFDRKTADNGAEGIAEGAALCINEARQDKLIAAGFTTASAQFASIASSNGLFGYHTATNAYAAETARTADGSGSGWASQAAMRIDDIDYAQLSRIARAKAAASAKPRPLDPGKYVTILEPACVANLVAMLLFSMSARNADEGRSFFSARDGGNRLGEKIFGDNINIYSDPTDREVPGAPWGTIGLPRFLRAGGSGALPQRPRRWIERGTIASLIYDRFWAQKQQKQPVPFPSNILMDGGQGSVDDLIASTKRGVLVTSLWYIRPVDPRILLFTGLTRDGVFWIENGKISHPVSNFRWNESPVSVLKNAVALSAPVRVPPRPRRQALTRMPAIKVKEFHFTSVSEAV